MSEKYRIHMRKSLLSGGRLVLKSPQSQSSAIMVAKHVLGWTILQFPMLTATPSRMLHAEITAITVSLNFDLLSMTHTIERQKHKHIIWKFEDVGLKR